MAVLPDNIRAQAHADLMREMSARRANIGAMVKADLRTLVNAIDDELNSAETAIFNALSPGALKTWIAANQAEARPVIRLVQKVREENL